jgi:hypothetical protein
LSEISVDVEFKAEICTRWVVVSVVAFSKANGDGIAVEVATDRISVGPGAC